MTNTQSNGTARQPGDERRFDRGSWIALAFALCLLAYNLLQAVLLWQVPGDGWLVNGELSADPPRAIFYLSLNDGPTALRQGDELLAAEGLLLKTFWRGGSDFRAARARLDRRHDLALHGAA